MELMRLQIHKIWIMIGFRLLQGNQRCLTRGRWWISLREKFQAIFWTLLKLFKHQGLSWKIEIARSSVCSPKIRDQGKLTPKTRRNLGFRLSTIHTLSKKKMSYLKMTIKAFKIFASSSGRIGKMTRTYMDSLQ